MKITKTNSVARATAMVASLIAIVLFTGGCPLQEGLPLPGTGLDAAPASTDASPCNMDAAPSTADAAPITGECKGKAAGTACGNPTNGACDKPEKCDGIHDDCPADTVFTDADVPLGSRDDYTHYPCRLSSGEDGWCNGASKTCQAPTCVDGNLDGLETGRDCGGPTCSPCANGGGCDLDRDCVSGDCNNGVCQGTTASCGNGVCEVLVENHTSCPQDCRDVPMVQLTVTSPVASHCLIFLMRAGSPGGGAYTVPLGEGSNTALSLTIGIPVDEVCNTFIAGSSAYGAYGSANALSLGHGVEVKCQASTWEWFNTISGSVASMAQVVFRVAGVSVPTPYTYIWHGSIKPDGSLVHGTNEEGNVFLSASRLGASCP